MKQNAINNKSAELTIDPGASGDSFVQFSINSTPEFVIGVDDTDDSFRISQGSALGTNDTFVITDAGMITKPLQPAFGATINNYTLDVTGDGTVYTVVWDGGEYFDQNNDFDGTSTFTAPVTGRYRFNASVLFDTLAAANTNGYIQLVTSNRTYRSWTLDYGNVYVSSFSANVGMVSALCDMDASDTCIVQVVIFGATKTVEVGFTNRGMFMGSLVC